MRSKLCRSHNHFTAKQQDEIAAQANLRSKLCRSHNHFTAKQQDEIAAQANLRSKLCRSHNHFTAKQQDEIAAQANLRSKLCRSHNPAQKYRNTRLRCRLLIRHQYSNVMPANAGIQWRANRANIYYRWIPGQARNDEADTVYMPDQ
ncbi:MAG: hypothetical protein IPM27_00135 [Nitrosomonadales bacterium]|nr:hypothetical protein [Nitrosomonadales bacterium]